MVAATASGDLGLPDTARLRPRQKTPAPRALLPCARAGPPRGGAIPSPAPRHIPVHLGGPAARSVRGRWGRRYETALCPMPEAKPSLQSWKCLPGSWRRARNTGVPSVPGVPRAAAGASARKLYTAVSTRYSERDRKNDSKNAEAWERYRGFHLPRRRGKKHIAVLLGVL